MEEELRSCPICGAYVQPPLALTYGKFGDFYGQRVTFVHCDDCGFTFAPENLSYPGHAQLWAERRHLRAGNMDSPGREFYMAVMGDDMMQLAGLPCRSMLLFGAGGSPNDKHLRRRFPDREICICDLKNSQNSEYFIPLDSQKTFDMVVACEVVEHFTDIKRHFSALLSKLNDAGLLIISTNINIGEALSESAYQFIPGHTAYYSGKSLRLAIEAFDTDMNVDFRMVEGLGKRKRYVICYKNRKLSSAVSEYFSTHSSAPSEQCMRLSFWMKLRRFGFRVVRLLRVNIRVHVFHNQANF